MITPPWVMRPILVQARKDALSSFRPSTDATPATPEPTPQEAPAMSKTIDIDFTPSAFERLADTTVGGEDSLDDAMFRQELVRMARTAPALHDIDHDSWMYDMSDDEFERMITDPTTVELTYLDTIASEV